MPIIQSIPSGPAVPIVRNQPYALPPRANHIFCTDPLEYSNTPEGPWISVEAIIAGRADSSITAQAASSAYRDKVIADGAVAYWRLGETSGTTAKSEIGSFDGTISGGVTLGQTGALSDGDKAMAFGGVNGIISTSTVNMPQTFTIELWIRSTDLPINRGFLSTSTVYLGSSAGTWRVYNPSNSPLDNSGVKRFDDGQWHHLVVVHQPTSITGYVDGVLDISRSITSTYSGISGSIDIGGALPYGGHYLAGSLDEVAIYPFALTPAQIATHYALSKKLDPYAAQVIGDGATAYWRLDEPSGTVAKSQVGSYDGTISGGVTLAQPGATTDGNKSMAFLGNGKIQTATTIAMSINTTIEAWIKIAGPLGPYIPYFSSRVIAAEAGEIFLGIFTDHPVYYSNSSQIDGTRNIADGKWHHVIWTLSATGQSLYVDGILDTFNPVTRSAATTRPIAIGGEPNATAPYFTGSIDEVAIYPYAFTPAQVAEHYTVGTTSLKKLPIAGGFVRCPSADTIITCKHASKPKYMKR